MSQYLYAVIPYKRDTPIKPDCPDSFEYFPFIPELQDLDSEFVDREGLTLHEGFLLINLCYKAINFIEKEDGYSYIRTEVYKIAQKLDAKEVWYVAEPCTDEMINDDFSFTAWKQKLKNEYKEYTTELTQDVLKGKTIYSYYHDNFVDIIL